MKKRQIVALYESGAQGFQPLVEQVMQEMFKIYSELNENYEIISNIYGTEKKSGANFSPNELIHSGKLQNEKLDAERVLNAVALCGADFLAPPSFSKMHIFQRSKHLFLAVTSSDMVLRQGNGQSQRPCKGLASVDTAVVVSGHGLQDKPEEFKTLLMRKIAIMLGMARNNNNNPACHAPNCIMHSKDNLSQLTQKRLKLEKEGKGPFCEDCIEQGRIHLKKILSWDKEAYDRFEKMRKMRKMVIK